MSFALYVVLIIFTIIIVAWRWVEGIDYMKKNHPDYKGLDLLDEEEDDESHTKKNP